MTSGSTAAKSRDVAGPAADALAFAGSALVVVAVVAVWLASARVRPDPQRLAVTFAAGVAAVLAFGKVLSPQYAEWLLFLVPLAAGAPGIAAAALAGRHSCWRSSGSTITTACSQSRAPSGSCCCGTSRSSRATACCSPCSFAGIRCLDDHPPDVRGGRASRARACTAASGRARRARGRARTRALGARARRR